MNVRNYLTAPAGHPRGLPGLKEVLILALFTGGLLRSAPAPAQPEVRMELESISERSPLAPQEALIRLAGITTEHRKLSLPETALLYEQFHKANFYAKNFAKSLSYGKQLELLGAKNNDKNIETSGQLAQVYAHWKLGNIQVAYSIARNAERIPALHLEPKLKIQTLLAVAQIEAEEHRPASALSKIDSALRLAGTDNTSRYNIQVIQAKILLASNDTPQALAVVDQLLALARQSAYPERLIRAKGLEFTSSSAAGLPSRANHAMAERIGLLRKMHLPEGLGAVLVDYADFKLNSNDYPAAAALSSEALGLPTVIADEQLAMRAQFNRAISNIQRGKVQEGKSQIELLLRLKQERAQLLNYLPQYAAALTRAGELNISLQAGVFRQNLEMEEALKRANESERSRGTLESLSREKALSVSETAQAQQQQKLWVIFSACVVLGLFALLWRHWRLRAGARALAETNRTSEIALKESAARQAVLRQQALESQLRILQAQIEPHFLFNTLANLRFIYRTDLAHGEEMLNHLIAYLRSAMDELRSDNSTLGRELELSRHYMSIMGIRMGGGLQYNISAPANILDTPFPPAMLLTLVENAIKHGLQNNPAGRIDIVATPDDDEAIWVTVLDNGAGISTIGGTGVGLNNVRQRLDAIYGSEATLQTGPLPTGGFAASIRLPVTNVEEIPCQLQ